MSRVALVLAVVGCGGSSSPSPTGSRVGAALTAAFAAADQARAPWRCAAADGPKLADEKLALGGHAWRLAGHTVTREGTAGTVTIAVIADAGGSAPATLAALGRLRTQLADVDVVIALGGMGATQAELEATLGTLAEKARGPVIAVPGDLESVTAQTAAIASLRARGLVVIDGRLARTVELPGATIATIPGARSLARLAAGADGCGYAPADATRVLAELTGRPGVRILATAEAPRVIVDGDPAGELALVPAAGQEVDVVVHAPVSEIPSPARTGGRDAAAIALAPGPSDATTRLPGPRRAASVGLLVVKAGSWSWRLLVDTN